MANDKFFINQPDYITHSPTAEPSVSNEGASRGNAALGHAPQATPTQPAAAHQAQQQVPYQTPQTVPAHNARVPQDSPASPSANRPQQPRVSYAQGNSVNGQQNFAEELPEDYFVGRSYSFGDKPMQKEDTRAAGVLKIIGTIVFVLIFLGVASRILSGFGEVSNNFSPFFEDGGFLPGSTVYFEEDDFPPGVELPEGAVILDDGEYSEEYFDDESGESSDHDEYLDDDNPFGGGPYSIDETTLFSFGF